MIWRTKHWRIGAGFENTGRVDFFITRMTGHSRTFGFYVWIGCVLFTFAATHYPRQMQ